MLQLAPSIVNIKYFVNSPWRFLFSLCPLSLGKCQDSPLPALVGNKRVHRGVGDVLVITYQETALLPLPATVMEGTPQKRRGSKAFWSRPSWAVAGRSSTVFWHRLTWTAAMWRSKENAPILLHILKFNLPLATPEYLTKKRTQGNTLYRFIHLEQYLQNVLCVNIW